MTREKFLKMINDCRKARNDASAQAEAIDIVKSAKLNNQESVIAPMQAAIVRAKADENYVKASIGRVISGNVQDMDTVAFLAFAEKFAEVIKTEDEVTASK